MKYFLQQRKGLRLAHQLPEGIDFRPFEITHKFALELYKIRAGSGFANLTAIPNFHSGIRVVGHFSTVWGETITNKECFKRRLVGAMGRDILNGE